MRGKDSCKQRIQADDSSIRKKAGKHDNGRERHDIIRAATEPSDHRRRADQRDNGQWPQIDSGGEKAEDRAARRAADIEPGEHTGCRPGFEADVNNDLRHPLDDEIETGDVGKVGRSDDNRRH